MDSCAICERFGLDDEGAGICTIVDGDKDKSCYDWCDKFVCVNDNADDDQLSIAPGRCAGNGEIRSA